MTKAPDHRYQSAKEFRSDLLAVSAPATAEEQRASIDVTAACLGDQIAEPPGDIARRHDEVTPVVEPESLKKHRERAVVNRWIGGLLIVLVCAAAAVTAWWGGAWDDSPPDEHDPDAGLAAVAGIDAGTETDSAGVNGNDLKATDAGLSLAQTRPDRRRPAAPIKLTRKIVNRILRRHGARFQRCANTHLAKEGARGDVELLLDFTIGAAGQVMKATLTPEKLESTDFGRCFLNHIRRIRFPRHRDKSITVGFPLRFKVTGP
jgi:hypothetical protein